MSSDLGGAALAALCTNGEGKRLWPPRNSEAKACPSRHPNRRPEGPRHLRATATPLVCSTPCQAVTRRAYPSKQPLPKRSPNLNAYFCGGPSSCFTVSPSPSNGQFLSSTSSFSRV